jgi:16S rRNA C967 or C1407 C5-methylase (RsmB/RsmF family)
MDSLLSFCKEHNIDPEIYKQGYNIPRFIRLKNPNEADTIIPQLQKELNCKLEPVQWLPKGFFSLPQNIGISKCVQYKNGLVYGIDVASAVAVLALNPKPDENILDLCCAPGGKLCYISDKLSSNTFRITGVDINLKRLSECKAVLKKYGIMNTRLILADGTKFHIVHPSESGGEICEVKCYEKSLKRVLKKIKENSKEQICFPKDVSDAGILFYETKGLYKRDRMLSQMQQGKSNTTTLYKSGPELFDKVLVDAECTTEGSVKHILKCIEDAKNHDFEKRYQDKERINHIVNLQVNQNCTVFIYTNRNNSFTMDLNN